MTSSSNIIEDLAKQWPILAKTYHYHFVTEITNFSKQNNVWQKTIERKIEIIYLGRKDGFRLYQVLTTKIILKSNKAFPNEILLKKLGYVFDYLELGVSNKGEIKKIFNINDVLLRFQDIKQQIEKDYYGLELDHLFQSMFKTIENEGKLIAFLHSYKMFGLFFNGLYPKFQSKPVEIIREIILQDFENQLIEEKIINKEDFTFDIILNKPADAIKNYSGIIKAKYNRILMGYLEIETQDINIKYNTSWVG